MKQNTTNDQPAKDQSDGPSEAPICSAYMVYGYAFVPIEVEMWIEDAKSPKQAMEKAKRMFYRSPNKRKWIVGNSTDEAAAFDFEPHSAMPPIAEQN